MKPNSNFLKAIYILAIFLCVNENLFAQKRKSVKKTTTVTSKISSNNTTAIQENSKANANEIEWLTVEEAAIKQAKEPRKIYMDVYTDWCGWCKVMDKKTFGNADCIKYMNENYYCVRVNAETVKEISYKGKVYGDAPNSIVNQLILDWMLNKTSYPTSIFFDEQFNIIQPLPGYMELKQFELIIKYLREDMHKKIQFQEYQKSFKNIWN